MMLLRIAESSLRMLRRTPVRATLSVLGIAVAVFLLCTERALQAGVREATEANDRDTRLIVYRANRFCPFTSKLPERYVDDILRIPGVRSAVPMQIAVSNCLTSLDVVVFRGVRPSDAERVLAPRLQFRDGSMSAFLARSDGALVGSALAERRRLKIGDRFASAGITVTVAAIVAAEGAQDRNACFVQLPFLQGSVGGVQGGDVTQFEVEAADPRLLTQVAEAIDARFAADAAPTTTRAEKAFVARAAEDLVTIARFAGWLGLAALAVVFALVANAIVLSLEGRVREIAILQSIGFPARLIAWSVVVEGVALASVGSLIGAGAASIVLLVGDFTVGAEGVLVEFRPSLGATLGALGAAIFVGLAASALPAASAARRSIVEGLRSA